MTTATVAGVFKTLDGAVYPSAPYVIEGQIGGITSNDATIYVPAKISGTTDSNGAISVSLQRARAYSLRVTTNDGIKFGSFTVPDSAGPFDLADLIDNGAVPPAPAAPETGATEVFYYDGRDDFISADLTGAAPGSIAYAAGLGYRRVTGASAITDKAGWLPIGNTSPGHFATNTTPGTTDMTAAILAAFAYMHSIGGGTIDGRGETFAMSVTVDLTAHIGVTCQNCTFSPIGTWAADTAMFRVNRNGGVERRYITFRDNLFDGKGIANGILVDDAGMVAVLRNRFYRIPNFGVRSATKATELRIEGNEFKQFFFGDTGWDVEANRTAYLIDIETADYMVYGNVANYGLECIRIRTRGPGQCIGNHFYNGGLASVSFQTRIGTFSGPNMQIIGNYFDNGLVRIDASVLDAGPGVQLIGNLFHKNAAATNTNVLEFFGGSGSTLPGLVISNNLFESGSNAILFTGTYAADEAKQWVVSGNAAKGGGRVVGLPVIAARNTFIADSVNGTVIRGPSTTYIPQDAETSHQMLFRRSLIIDVDHDANSGDKRGALRSRGVEALWWDDAGITINAGTFTVTTPATEFAPAGSALTSDLNFLRGAIFNVDSNVNNTGAEARGSLRSQNVERFRWSDGGIAFFDKAAVPKQTVTGAKGGNAALDSLIDALVAYGLITDTTTA